MAPKGGRHNVISAQRSECQSEEIQPSSGYDERLLPSQGNARPTGKVLHNGPEED